jgi:tetratricopeptide (TPR) repeat protein
MKTPVLLAGLILLKPLMAQVGNADLQDIQTLVTAGKYEEALKKHLWFHEESKTSRGMGGVRLSFALNQWLELGEAYPPALAALKGLRDENEAKLLSGAGGFREFHDFSAINRTLKDDERTYRLFLQLDAQQLPAAKQCFDVTLDLIVAHKNYDLYAKYGGDPIVRYERFRNLREVNLGMARKNPMMDNERIRAHTDNTFTDKTVQLIEILVQLKRLDEAREIQKRALEYFPSPRIEQSLTAL